MTVCFVCKQVITPFLVNLISIAVNVWSGSEISQLFNFATSHYSEDPVFMKWTKPIGEVFTQGLILPLPDNVSTFLNKEPWASLASKVKISCLHFY